MIFYISICTRWNNWEHWHSYLIHQIMYKQLDKSFDYQSHI